jgi:hypothetical protein
MAARTFHREPRVAQRVASGRVVELIFDGTPAEGSNGIFSKLTEEQGSNKSHQSSLQIFPSYPR